MALEHELGAAASQLAQFHLDVELKPDLQQHERLKPVLGPSGMSAVSVTVTDLPTPPFSPDGLATPDGDTIAPGTFPFFPLLPAELRLKIWHMSFLPRTVELHTRRTHYADDDDMWSNAIPKWQSQSRNPAALSVNAEARAAALEFYTVALPLAHQHQGPGDRLQDSDRVLYLNLEQDMVVLLGELHYLRLTRLLKWFRKMDEARQSQRRSGDGREGVGLRRLAMSVAAWAHERGAETLKAFNIPVFGHIEEFVLFMYMDRMPPPAWSGGSCVLEEASPDEDHYRRFVMGRGKQFRDRQRGGWMQVGQRPLKIAEIRFDDGW